MSEFDYMVKRDGVLWVVVHGEEPVEWFDTFEGAELAAELYRNGVDPDADL